MFQNWTTKVRGPGCWGSSLSPCSARNSRELAALFPPGATSISQKTRSRSNWREFQFAFHQIQSAITPHLGLQSTLRQWTEISAALSERSRKRKPQIEFSETSA